MSEIILQAVERDIFMYASVAAGTVGAVIQLILSMIYKKNLRSSDSIRTAKLKWMRQMRVRFDSLRHWNDGLANPELFVDKYMGRRTLLGVYLVTWEEISRMLIPFSLVFAAIDAAFAYSFGEEAAEVLLRFTVGVAAAAGLKLLIILTNLKEKRNILRVNLLEYFENAIHNEQRKRMNAETACSLEENEDCGNTESENFAERKAAFGVRNERKETKTSSTKKEEKKELRNHLRLQKREARQQKKEDAREKKEKLRMEKLAHRMEKMQQRMGKTANAESEGTLRAALLSEKEAAAKLKREELKRKVEVSPAEEENIISEVLKEFLA